MGDLENIKKLALEGDPDAQYRLGESYEEGKGVEQDQKEAVKWYRLAARQGHVNAKAALSRFR